MIFEAGASANAKTWSGLPALSMAICVGDVAGVKLLLSMGCTL
jgi:hypothetical protein